MRYSFEFPTLVLMNIQIFCDVAICRLLSSYRRFGGWCCLQLQGLTVFLESSQKHTFMRSGHQFDRINALRIVRAFHFWILTADRLSSLGLLVLHLQPLQTNAGTDRPLRPRLFPSTSLTIYFSLIIVPYDSTNSDLHTVSLKLTTNKQRNELNILHDMTRGSSVVATKISTRFLFFPSLLQSVIRQTNIHYVILPILNLVWPHARYLFTTFSMHSFLKVTASVNNVCFFIYLFILLIQQHYGHLKRQYSSRDEQNPKQMMMMMMMIIIIIIITKYLLWEITLHVP